MHALSTNILVACSERRAAGLGAPSRCWLGIVSAPGERQEHARCFPEGETAFQNGARWTMPSFPPSSLRAGCSPSPPGLGAHYQAGQGHYPLPWPRESMHRDAHGHPGHPLQHVQVSRGWFGQAWDSALASAAVSEHPCSWCSADLSGSSIRLRTIVPEDAARPHPNLCIFVPASGLRTSPFPCNRDESPVLGLGAPALHCSEAYRPPRDHSTGAL